MNNDPGILCLKHCSCVIFGLTCPDKCPKCYESISHDSSYPFRVPYPFSRASQNPCSIVLKPTNGDFLNDYRNAQDLHIGVTDSRGAVHAYDERGLGKEADWDQCLAIPVWSTATQLHAMEDAWNESLQRVEDSNVWTPDRYREDSLNCYSFVLSFLQLVKVEGYSELAANKSAFCNRVLLPFTTSAAKYITVYRNVTKYGVFVQEKE